MCCPTLPNHWTNKPNQTKPKTVLCLSVKFPCFFASTSLYSSVGKSVDFLFPCHILFYIIICLKFLLYCLFLISFSPAINRTCIVDIRRNRTCIEDSRLNRTCIVDIRRNRTCIEDSRLNRTCIVDIRLNRTCIVDIRRNRTCIEDSRLNRTCIVDIRRNPMISLLIVSYNLVVNSCNKVLFNTIVYFPN